MKMKSSSDYAAPSMKLKSSSDYAAPSLVLKSSSDYTAPSLALKISIRLYRAFIGTEILNSSLGISLFQKLNSEKQISMD